MMSFKTTVRVGPRTVPYEHGYRTATLAVVSILWRHIPKTLSVNLFLADNEADFGLFVWPMYPIVGQFLVRPSIQFGVNQQNIKCFFVSVKHIKR